MNCPECKRFTNKLADGMCEVCELTAALHEMFEVYVVGIPGGDEDCSYRRETNRRALELLRREMPREYARGEVANG